MQRRAGVAPARRRNRRPSSVLSGPQVLQPVMLWQAADLANRGQGTGVRVDLDGRYGAAAGIEVVEVEAIGGNPHVDRIQQGEIPLVADAITRDAIADVVAGVGETTVGTRNHPAGCGLAVLDRAAERRQCTVPSDRIGGCGTGVANPRSGRAERLGHNQMAVGVEAEAEGGRAVGRVDDRIARG
jgi:hypothetical protein